MKKTLSFLLAFVMLFAIVLPISVFSVSTVSISAKDVNAMASHAVEVDVVSNGTASVAAATVKIKYDTDLELLSVENGNAFPTISEQSIYGKTPGVQNGEFTFVYGSTTNTAVSDGSVLFTLRFRVPENATVGTSYEVTVDKEVTETVKIIGSGSGATTESGKMVEDSVSKITVAETVGECAAHNYANETVLSKESYISMGYSYKECSSCGRIEVTKTPSKSSGIAQSLGFAVRYAGNPTGIGAGFKIDVDKIAEIEKASCSVNVIIGYKHKDSIKEETRYKTGDGLSVLPNNAACVKIENISSYDMVEVYLTVIVTDKATGKQSKDIVYATLQGKTSVSIYDVVGRMDITKYDEASRNYLNGVRNGVL